MTETIQMLDAGSRVTARIRFCERVSKMTTPHMRTGLFLTSQKLATVNFPEGSQIQSFWIDSSDNETNMLVEIDDVLIELTGMDRSISYILACDPTDGENAGKHIDGVLSQLNTLFPPVEPFPKDTINVGFWFWMGNGAAYRTRDLASSPWEKIATNYSKGASDALGQLVNTDSSKLGEGGRLILLHGPAGTGKTTAIRALANAWEPWCAFDYVVDPDEMFARAGYLMEVMLDTRFGQKWRCIVIEDAEEFLVPDAKSRVGQSVARLLNLSDGMIGQGLRLLVLMTTNAPGTQLHEAIKRPGRCLADIEVPRMTASEAAEWSGGGVKEESTLAELYEAQRQSQIGNDRIEWRAGSYL